MKRFGSLRRIESCSVVPAKAGIQDAGGRPVFPDHRGGVRGILMSFMTKREEHGGAAGNQKGSVLVIALLILVFLTLIGISGTTITEIEIQIAGNERAHNIAFYNADSGVYLTPKIIRRTVEEGVRAPVAVTYNPVTDDGSFFRRVMGYDTTASNIRFPPDPTQNTILTNVDTIRGKQVSLGGGGVEFGSGAEGVGVGSAGGVAIIYQMDSTGPGPNNASSNITAEYRLVPGVAGGL